MGPIFNKLDVAIHEAGHAVCNHFFGRTTEKIVLTFRPALNEWHGETHAVPPKVRFRTNFSFGPAAPVEPLDFSPLAAECVIAAAGYFAQVLKTGREVRPDLLLSAIQDWPSLLGWLFDKRLVTEKPECFQWLSQLEANWLVSQFRHVHSAPEIKRLTAACGTNSRRYVQDSFSLLIMMPLRKVG